MFDFSSDPWGFRKLLEAGRKCLHLISFHTFYQFQNYSQYRCKLQSKDDAEINLINDALEENVWSVHSVLNVLQVNIFKNISKAIRLLIDFSFF